MTKRYEFYGLWDFVRKQKAAGKIRHIGFSFHGSPELLDELLSAHPEVEFVQLQINYADWNNPRVQSHRCWEVARKHDKPVTIMEPVKGGTLADPPAFVKDILTAANPSLSPAGWAIRYAASLDDVLAVLSGMSNVAQMNKSSQNSLHANQPPWGVSPFDAIIIHSNLKTVLNAEKTVGVESLLQFLGHPGIS